MTNKCSVRQCSLENTIDVVVYCFEKLGKSYLLKMFNQAQRTSTLVDCHQTSVKALASKRPLAGKQASTNVSEHESKPAYESK